MRAKYIKHSQKLVFFARIFYLLLVYVLSSYLAEAATNVAGIKITSTTPAYNAATQTFDSLVTLTNTKKTPITGPLAILVSGISVKGVSVVEPMGLIKNNAYLPVPLPSGVLAPRQTVGNIVIHFNNTKRKKFSFAKKIITGLPGITPILPNHLPVANAGPDQTVNVGGLAKANGSGSTDVDGNTLSYHWLLLQKPFNSNAVLSNPEQVRPNLTLDQPGRYKLQLIVNDGLVNSFPDTVIIDTENAQPFAHAGLPQKAKKGDTVTLNGSLSSDWENDPLSYEWSLLFKPTGSKAKLFNPKTQGPFLKVDKAGDYTARLQVIDNLQKSEPAVVTISSINSIPVANAGADLTNHVLNQPVTLNGSGSSDADGENLTYSWSLISKPVGSNAQLTLLKSVASQFTPDLIGDYVAQLLVIDSHYRSDPDTVLISAIAANVPNFTGLTETQARINIIYANLTIGNITYANHATVAKDLVISQIPASDSSATSGAKVDLVVSLGPVTENNHINQAPLINSSAPQTPVTAGQTFSYAVNANDADNNTLTYSLINSPEGMSINATSGLINWIPSTSQTGNFSAAVRVDDGQGGTDNQLFSITVNPQTIKAPNLAGVTEDQAKTNITNAGFSVGTITSANDANIAKGLVISQLPSASSQLAQGSAINLVISLGKATNPNNLPPDPATIAPTLDSTVATTVASSTAFLYTGSNPIQTGVSPGTIEAKRTAVIRGKVLDKDNKPLPGVTISIKDHSEYGQTLSRADGQFDLAVNGGGAIIVNYSKTNYLPIQRQTTPAWNDFAQSEDVIMIQPDAKVSVVNLADASQPIHVAQGSVVTDQDGTRQATLLIPNGTAAQIYNPDGSTKTVNSLTLHMTEFTVGTNGPNTMPGPLPPTSAYTYAIDIKADEASTTIAGTEVQFSQPVPFYVENFLNLPVGSGVPSGYYDRDKAAWIPAPDGRVIKILSVAGGIAALDIDGDSLADDTTKLSSLGIADAERTELAKKYGVNTSLWRMPLSHLSSYDFNFSKFLNRLAGLAPPWLIKPLLDSVTCLHHSIIECETQILGEDLALSGTSIGLHYRSNHTPGRIAENTVDIPLSGATVPEGLQRIDLQIHIAGRVIRKSFPALANQNYQFAWDGNDAYGRTWTGSTQVLIRTGYVYKESYGIPKPGTNNNFGQFPAVPFDANRSKQEYTLWRETRLPMGYNNRGDQGIAGWSLTNHHIYDPIAGVLYRGDGSRERVKDIDRWVIQRFAGAGGTTISSPLGDGRSAVKAHLLNPESTAISPNGSVYIAQRNRIRKVDRFGDISTYAGNGSNNYSGDGGQAVNAGIASSTSTPKIALGSDGSLYLTQYYDKRVRRVDPNGIISVFAGNGTDCTPRDGGPAIAAGICTPTDVAVGPDGSVYIAERHLSTQGPGRIRKVGADGIISTVVGSGDGTFLDSGSAANTITDPLSIAVGADGSLYILERDGYRIRKVTPDGIITTAAGNGRAPSGYQDIADGTPATAISISANDIDVDVTGNLYIADKRSVRKVSLDGTITTLAGNGESNDPHYSLFDEGKLGRQSSILPQYISAGPDGAIYVTDTSADTLTRIAPNLPMVVAGNSIVASTDTLIPSHSGSEIYVFRANRHYRTLNAYNNMVMAEFGYDSNGRLIQTTDANGNALTIKRDLQGHPTAIIAPFGQTTTLATDANGYLSKITDPNGASYQIGYSADGLLTSIRDPNGNASTMTYDSQGRLLKDQDAVGGYLALARTDQADGYKVAVSDTAGSTTSHTITTLADGSERRSNLYPDGTQTVTDNLLDGSHVSTTADGSSITVVDGPDPRFGMTSPIMASATITTGGLTLNAESSSTAVLANEGDPLSLTKLTDTFTINGRTATSVYEATSKTVSLTSPANRKASTVLDALGRVTQTQLTGILATSASYDAQGRLANVSQGTGVNERKLDYTYNPQGYLASVLDQIGRQVQFQYDQAGRVTTQILPDGRQILYSYDAKGNLISLTPPGQPAHIFNYTAVDQTADYQPPLVGAGSNSTVYTYDKDKALVSVARPDGQSIAINHDGAGRAASLVLSPTSQTLASYAYDTTTGKLTTVTVPDGGLGYSYNGALLTQTAWTGAVSGSVDYAYDNNFNITSVSLNGANPIAYSYDNDDLLTKAGNLTLTRSSQNGLLTGTALGSLTEAYSYSGFGELSSYEAKYNAFSHLKLAYSRDKLGRIIQKQETRGGVLDTYDYGYDTAGRLVDVKKNNVVQASYSYDDNGNRLSRTAGSIIQTGTYDAQDRLLTYNGASYSYTDNGELKTKTVGAAVTQYDYDVLGNLKKVVLPSGGKIDYLTDGQNRRIGKKVNGSLTQAFLWQDQLQPIAELDGGGNVVSRFVYATGVNVPDYMIKGGVTYRLIKDHLGSPRVVVDIASNTVAQEMEFDEFGRVTKDTNPGFQPFGFAGGLYDKDTGLVRFGARDYDASVGRWVSKDPIGFGGGDNNIYSYAFIDPINLTDPSGKFIQLIGIGLRGIGICLANPTCRPLLKTLFMYELGKEGWDYVGDHVKEAIFGCDNLFKCLENWVINKVCSKPKSPEAKSGATISVPPIPILLKRDGAHVYLDPNGSYPSGSEENSAMDFQYNLVHMFPM